MNKRRYKLHVKYSLGYVQDIPKEDWYTEEEFKQGYHFCHDWDGLFIGPDDVEFEYCTCHPSK